MRIKQVCAVGTVAFVLALGALWLNAKIFSAATAQQNIERTLDRSITTIIPDSVKPLRVITSEQLQTLGKVQAMIGFAYCGVPIAVQLIGSKGFYVQVIYPEAPETLDAAQAALQFGKDSGAPFKRVELREGCKAA